MFSKTVVAGLASLALVNGAPKTDFLTMTSDIKGRLNASLMLGAQKVQAVTGEMEEPSLIIDLDNYGREQGAYQMAGASTAQIRVTENASTGYRWTINDSTCGVRFQELRNHYEKGQGIGAAGHRVWTFKTPQPEENYIRGQECELTLVNSRPWESANETNAKFEKVRVVVN